MNRYIKKFIVLLFAVAIFFNSNVFADKMIKVGDTYFLEDDYGKRQKNKVYDLGPEVGTYFFGMDGSLMTGWYSDKKNNAIYFFVNDKKKNYGAMVFGFAYIDGYLRFFYPENGRLAISQDENLLDIEGIYNVDNRGFIYTKDGTLCRDTSTSKSEYYTNLNYYLDDSLNNRTLAENGGIVDWDGNLIGKMEINKNQKSLRISNGAKLQLAEKVTDKSNLVTSKNIR